MALTILFCYANYYYAKDHKQEIHSIPNFTIKLKENDDIGHKPHINLLIVLIT